MGTLADTKKYDHVPLVEGHYQDAYLFATRSFSSSPPTPPSEEPGVALVQQVLTAVTPFDILGVPEDISMRGLHRRWAALNKALSALGEDDADAFAAFVRVKEARDAIRNARGKEAGDPVD